MKASLSQAPIHVFIIDPHQIVRLGLISALSTYQGFVCAGEAETATDRLTPFEGMSVDVFLVNDTDSSARFETCRQLRSSYPHAGIVLLMSNSNTPTLLQAFDAGANAFCLRDIKIDRLMAAIISTRNGDYWIDSQIAFQLTDNFQVPPTSQCATSEPMLKSACSLKSSDSFEEPIFLTARERQVLDLIVHGQTNQDIADSLVISLATAKAHVRSILSKLKADHRTQAAVEAVRRGLV